MPQMILRRAHYDAGPHPRHAHDPFRCDQADEHAWHQRDDECRGEEEHVEQEGAHESHPPWPPCAASGSRTGSTVVSPTAEVRYLMYSSAISRKVAADQRCVAGGQTGTG